MVSSILVNNRCAAFGLRVHSLHVRSSVPDVLNLVDQSETAEEIPVVRNAGSADILASVPEDDDSASDDQDDASSVLSSSTSANVPARRKMKKLVRTKRQHIDPATKSTLLSLSRHSLKFREPVEILTVLVPYAVSDQATAPPGTAKFSDSLSEGSSRNLLGDAPAPFAFLLKQRIFPSSSTLGSRCEVAFDSRPSGSLSSVVGWSTNAVTRTVIVSPPAGATVAGADPQSPIPLPRFYVSLRVIKSRAGDDDFEYTICDIPSEDTDLKIDAPTLREPKAFLAKLSFEASLPRGFVLEEVYENQRRLVGVNSFSARNLTSSERSPWSTLWGESRLPLEYIPLPPASMTPAGNSSWEWLWDTWVVDDRPRRYINPKKVGSMPATGSGSHARSRSRPDSIPEDPSSPLEPVAEVASSASSVLMPAEAAGPEEFASCDAAGWQYANKWSSNTWSATPGGMSAVRRRRWIRLRVCPGLVASELSSALSKCGSAGFLSAEAAIFDSDRWDTLALPVVQSYEDLLVTVSLPDFSDDQRLALLVAFIDHSSSGLSSPKTSPDEFMKVISYFRFDATRRKALELIAERFPGCLADAPGMVNSLVFFTNRVGLAAGNKHR
ncbi:hypothetical protein H696_01940 [Fonticula alba]|uniref:TECPR1-like DysF domain-containing protein n=1 Tax=Fonticula alba TaxID=691883 RepID=A0A058Z9N1_FONAL|nr:hypothetical protein H696_01940 [Fonticula alba]KCV70994.1 hypothetical protein H696_01940 [Fonticula alba]|eukprot:XP_009494117.1 hypothetical protein H696_01940 [Fonticula alba]